MNPLRLAVIGAGHLGRIHARLATDLQDAELIAVVDVDEHARKQVATELGIRGVSDIGDLDDPIDAAILATPTTSHHRIGMELASAGVHLFIEKPLAANLNEAEQLVETARQAGVVLQVGHVERFNPAWVAVAPHLTQPKYIEAVRVSGYPFRSTDIGVVLDLMIHDLDVILSLVDSPVQQVQGLGISILGQHEDVAQARLQFANGCVANLSASRVSYTARREIQVWTSGSFAAVDFGNRRVTQVIPRKDVLNRQFDLDALTPSDRSSLKDHLFDDVLARQTLEAEASNPIADEQHDFVSSIRSGRDPRVTGEQGRDALAVAERVLEQIAQHSWEGGGEDRRGPFAMPVEPVLHLPQWAHPLDPTRPRREAG